MALLYAFALLAGITNTVMAGCNTTLLKRTDQPLMAAVVVYLVGLISAAAVAIVAVIAGRAALPSTTLVSNIPWWGWLGGALGSIYIIAGIIVPGRIGAGSFTGMTVTAAIITSLVMDHFALVGFQQHSAGIARIIGAGLMLTGLFLIAKF